MKLIFTDMLRITTMTTMRETHSLASMRWGKLSWAGSRCANKCTAPTMMYSGSNDPTELSESTHQLHHLTWAFNQHQYQQSITF